MATTIQIKETTKQLLDKLKIKEEKKSYDEVIEEILKKEIKIPDMFGFTKKKLLKFNKEDEMNFNEI
jgi:predicted CopG family antitoxin